MSLSDLKKNRHETIAALNAEMEKFNKKVYTDGDADERFWYPAVDKAGNGNAIVRLLPATEGETLPFIRYWSHSFQGPTGLWIVNEMCPTTKGKKCPICDYNRELWNSGDEAKKKLASKQKRRLNFISNVLVLKDPANPDNEGQVKLFRYGQKIWDKINELMHPSFEGEESVNPFDFWEGAPLKIKIRNVDNYRNYDKSEFGTVGPLFKDDKQIDAVWKKEYALQPFIADELFRDEATIKARLEQVLGLREASSSADETPFFSDAELNEKKKTKAPRELPAKVEDEEDLHVPVDEEIDENYFANLT